MRCYCCNKPLSHQEATAKFAVSGNFTEMCNGCLSTIVEDVPVEDPDTSDNVYESVEDEEISDEERS